MLLHPAWSTIFQRKPPLVKLFDVRSDDTDLTTYTFTACHIPEIGLGSHETAHTYGVGLPGVLRSPTLSAIAVIAHGEDAAVTFNVSSITIGGVAGVERVDRGGGTNAINTAIYTWSGRELEAIANTDIAVTWSEAITACAIGVLGIYNIGLLSFIGSSSATSATSLNANVAASLTGHETHALVIVGSTLSVGAGAEGFNCTMDGISNGAVGVNPTILYDQSSAEISFGAYWSYTPQYCGGDEIHRSRGSWSGAAVGDIVTVGFV